MPPRSRLMMVHCGKIFKSPLKLLEVCEGCSLAYTHLSRKDKRDSVNDATLPCLYLGLKT
jgi:uncharacterized protein (DUF983 family)